MGSTLDDGALDLIFRDARSHNAWRDEPVSDDQLKRIFDLAKMGPTSANSSPARFVFLRSAAARERLRPHLLESNVTKTMTAAAVVIVGYDLGFPDTLPRLFPHDDARSWFVGNDALIESTAFRNGTLQGAYLMIAARALGLDCGPMSGFDNAGVDAAFFAGTNIKSNFLICLGTGDPAGLFPRHPRFDFAEVCEIV